MKHPLYSVLIANYNNGKYLSAAIESVINQTYTNWEIIITDDCSTDNSKAIYNNYNTDRRIKIFYNKKNSGRGFTKQRCFEHSSGEICSVLDADDKLAFNALERMVEFHQTRPDCSLIYSTHYNYTDKDGIIGISENNGEMGEDNDFSVTSTKIISHLVSFKRESLLKTSGIEAINMADDVDLYLKLEEVGEVYFVNEPLYYYRVDNSISAARTVLKTYSNNVTSKVFLNAFRRRILSKSDLYLKKKQKYFNALDYWFKIYLENSTIFDKEKVYYIYIYIKCLGLKFSTIKKLAKLLFYIP